MVAATSVVILHRTTHDSDLPEELCVAGTVGLVMFSKEGNILNGGVAAAPRLEPDGEIETDHGLAVG